VRTDFAKAQMGAEPRGRLDPWFIPSVVANQSVFHKALKAVRGATFTGRPHFFQPRGPIRQGGQQIPGVCFIARNPGETFKGIGCLQWLPGGRGSKTGSPKGSKNSKRVAVPVRIVHGSKKEISRKTVTLDTARAKLLFQGRVVLAGATVATVPENPASLVSGDQLANDVSSHPLAKSEGPTARRDVAFQCGEGVVKPPLCGPAKGLIPGETSS